MGDEKNTLENEIATREAAMKNAMKTTFKPWVDELTQDISGLGIGISSELMKHPPSKQRTRAARKALQGIRDKVKAVKNNQSSGSRSALANRLQHILTRFADVLGEPTIGESTDLVTLHQSLMTLSNRLDEIRTRQQLIEKLENDVTFVFGKMKAKKQVFVDPSVIQLLDHGFIRNDQAKGKEGGSFNAEFTAAMMQHGFTPGGAWTSSVDTMHYDYQPGYQKLKGRSLKSMTAGPQGVRGKARPHRSGRK